MIHINQDCGSSCGPTSLKMIMVKVGYKDNLDIQDIFAMSSTKIGGTPWSRMSKIIRDLNIKHKVIVDVPLSYFKTIAENKIWMLSVYYSGIKHWVVLKKSAGDYYLIFDPADTIKEYSKSELYNIFSGRNSLVIEFDLDDFLGSSVNYETHDLNGDYVMNYVDKYKMILLEDSNFIFDKLGKKVESIEEIYEGDFESDYIYGLFDYNDVVYDKYIFGYSIDKIILLRYK
jgi:ABC-type bacteriocin/lantibiotic exporter with double-glycine peptidase domain